MTTRLSIKRIAIELQLAVDVTSLGMTKELANQGFCRSETFLDWNGDGGGLNHSGRLQSAYDEMRHVNHSTLHILLC